MTGEPLHNEGARPAISLPALLLDFLKIGAIGFGGGMAIIALMERDLIRKRRVLEAEEFLQGVGLGQVLGPFAVNTALFVGNRLYGTLGGLACAFAFMAPSVLIVILLSWLYFSFHAIPALQGAIGGLGPVVIALILVAAWSMGRKAARSWPSVLMAALALALSLFKINAVYILAGAGIIGLIAGKRINTKDKPPKNAEQNKPQTSGGGGASVTGIAALPAVGSVSAGIFNIAWVFLKIGFIFFGGGFVLIPILQQRLGALGWLTQKEFVDGVAISNLTPGPIAVLATFAGFHLHGVLGALAATLALFTPAMILMTLMSREYSRFKDARYFKNFMGGVTPAVVGMVAGAAVLLSPGILHDIAAWGLLATALFLLARFQWHPAWVLAIGATLGTIGIVR